MSRILCPAALGVLGAALCAQDPPIPADTEIVSTSSGLKYSVLNAGPGTGEFAKPDDLVRVHYTGWLYTGEVFDSSRMRGRPASFVVRDRIKGWAEGMQLMKVGDRFKFTIPPDLAYGEKGRLPTIPPRATLYLDVELIEIIELPKFRPADPDAQRTTESGLTYELLVEGSGDRPAEDDIVDFKFAIWNDDRTLVQCTEKDAITIKFPIKGKLPVGLPGFLPEAASLMRIGDRMRFEVPAELGTGRGASTWELELLGVKKALPVPEFSDLDPDKTESTPSGLEYQVLEPGTGRRPAPLASVTVHYAGWLADGTPFDSSYERGETSSFPLNRVIRGWGEGVQLMREGATYKFRIPPQLGYGAAGFPPTIPPNATLIFVIELVKAR